MPVLLLVTSLFIGVPLLEIYLLIQIGGVIGAGYTIALVIGSGLSLHESLAGTVASCLHLLFGDLFIV